MAKKEPTFPDVLYVKVEGIEKDEAYFTAFETMYGLAEHGETVKIATYKLICIDEVELKLDVKKSIE